MIVTINNNRFELVKGDITAQDTEAIVNAANGTLMGGGGVDGAIHRKAGFALKEECLNIRKEVLHGAYLATGEAVITKGYNLPANYVIHTVGPIWKGNKADEEQLLTNCYQNSLALASEKGIKSISFPSISTGVFRFPIELASKIALGTIIEFLETNSFGDVRFVLFSQQDFEVYESTLKNMLDFL